MSFRDRFLTPRVARATTSPSAILATGAGAAVGVLAFGGPVAAIGFGICAYVARVLAAVPGAPARPSDSTRHLAEPWRSLMSGVVDARHRYDRAIAPLKPGPLRDRLVEVRDRLDDAVDEAARIATAGSTLADARDQVDLAALQGERRQVDAAPPTKRSAQTAAAIDEQIAAAARLDQAIADIQDRLRLLDARLDETVTRTVEIVATQAGADEVGGLGSEVDDIVSEMESLRLAVEETDEPSPDGAGSADLTGSADLAGATDPAEAMHPAEAPDPTDSATSGGST